MEENWKVIVVDGKELKTNKGRNAMISNFGRYKNCHGVISEPLTGKNGYCSVGTKHHKVHRLVAEAFIHNDDPEKKKEVNHKDCNPSNNHVDNLEWVSRSENVKHSYATNKNRKSSATKRSKPIFGRKVGSDVNEWVKYKSSMDAGRKLDIDSGTIRSCCRGERKTTKGYEFKYEAMNMNSADNIKPGRSFGNQPKSILGRKFTKKKSSTDSDEWIRYESIQEAARKLSIDASTVSACCRGKSKTAKGYDSRYKFKYDTPNEKEILHSEE